MRGNKFIAGFLVLLPLLLGAGCSVGSVTPLSGGPKECGSDLVCFEGQLKKCAPASLKNSMAETSGDVTIHGPKNSGCEVSITVISGKDSSPVVTTCLFDSSKSYADNMLKLSDINWFKKNCTQKK